MGNWLLKKFRESLASWKTTGLGVAMILIGSGEFVRALFGEGDFDLSKFSAHWEAIMAGVALIIARDNTTATESVESA